MLLRRKSGFQPANIVGRYAKRSGSEDHILMCKYPLAVSPYAVDFQKNSDCCIVVGGIKKISRVTAELSPADGWRTKLCWPASK